jgi:ABC-type nitrate/sulfonate/bicarbonate transport system substrate-binding protein
MVLPHAGAERVKEMPRKLLKGFMASASLFSILLTGACASQGAPAGSSSTEAASAEAASDEVFVLRTSTKKNCTSTPFVVGEAKGFFEANGIKIEYTGELGSGDALPAVLNGTNDFEGTLPNALATYVAEGAPIKAVTLNQTDPPADLDPKYRHMRFYVSPDLGVSTLEELNSFRNGEGLTISGRAPSCSSFIPNQIFKNNGLDSTRLEYVAFDSDTAAIQAVQQGNLDIAGIHPPFYYLAEQEGLILLADSADSGLGAAAGTSVFYFTDDFIAENPEAVQRFVTAIKQAQKWTLENEDEAIALTAEYIEKEINAVHYYFSSDGFPTDLLQPWIDDLVQEGALEEGQVTIEDLTAPQFQ